MRCWGAMSSGYRIKWGWKVTWDHLGLVPWLQRVMFTLQVLEKGKALHGHALDQTGFETWFHSLLAGLLWASTEAHSASMSSSIKWG